MLLSQCTGTSKGISPDPSQMHYPIGIAVHPTGKFLYVVNANFDLAYTGGSVMVFNTNEDQTGVFDINGITTELKTLTMLKDATVEIGSFGAQIVLNNAGTKAYVAVRQDRKKDTSIDVSSIVVLDIDTSKSGKGHLACNEFAITNDDTGGVGEENKYEQTPAPKCGDASKIFMEDNPFPYELTLVNQCTGRRTCTDNAACACSDADKQAGLCDADQACLSGQCVPKCTADADCGTGFSCVSQTCQRPSTNSTPICNTDSDCPKWETCKEARLLATHLQTGGLSEIAISTSDAPDNRRVTGIDSLPTGVTSLALLPPQTPLGGVGDLFLTSRASNDLFLLPPQLPPSVGELQQVTLNHTTSNNQGSVADLRGVTVGYDKKNNKVRLYVAARRPAAAVLVYNLERIENTLAPTLVGYIPVGADPSQLVYRQREAPDADLLYVVCSRDGRLDVINVESMQPIRQIKVGKQPYFMAIYEPTAGAEVQRRRAYVANFQNTTISIIDLDSHRLIGMVKGIDTRPPLP